MDSRARRWQNKCIHYLAPHAASEWCGLNIQPGDLQSIDIATEMTTTGSCAPLLPRTFQTSASGKITTGTEVLTQMIHQRNAWHFVLKIANNKKTGHATHFWLHTSSRKKKEGGGEKQTNYIRTFYLLFFFFFLGGICCGWGRVRIADNHNYCLLYTSPSPRD